VGGHDDDDDDLIIIILPLLLLLLLLLLFSRFIPILIPLLTTPGFACAGSEEEVSFAVVGDLGQTNDSMLTIEHMLQDPTMNMVIHAGDAGEDKRGF
jgi:hypothetical protein